MLDQWNIRFYFENKKVVQINPKVNCMLLVMQNVILSVLNLKKI